MMDFLHLVLVMKVKTHHIHPGFQRILLIKTIYSDTNIKRVVISNNRATHIEVENGSNSKKIAVNKVILSVTLNTPDVMDSGYSNKQLERT